MDELDQVLSAEVFKYSYRMSRLLRFLVEHTLEYPARPLKEHLLALRVFDKPESFDPRIDPIVRVEASRLRVKLRDYYHGEGATHLVQIHLPRRGYRPVLTLQRPKPDGAAPLAKTPAMGRTALQAPVDSSPSLLVLPFLDLSVDQSEEYFCDGLAEELINLIARTPGLRVVARTSAFRFKNAEIDIREIAERLQVSAILEGSVRREGDVVRISVQLLSAADGYHMWSDTYQRPLRHVFSIQHEITRAIADALKLKLAISAEAPVPDTRLDASKAYHLYLRGLHAWNRRTGEGFHQAIDLLHEAAGEDPDDARIQAKLAQCHIGLLLTTATDSKETLGLAEACCHRALGLAPDSGEALAALGFVRAVRDWQWAESESVFLRALSHAPGDPTVHEWYATACLAPRGRFDRAIAHLGQALDLDPVSVSVRSHLGMLFYLQRRYAEAVRELKLALELEPGFTRGRFDLGMALTMLGRYEEALQAFQEARRADRRSAFRLGALGYCYGRAGLRQEAAALLDELRSLPAEARVSAYCLAKTMLGLDDPSGALDMLRCALHERPDRLIWLDADPVFEPLHAEPEFQEICRTMGL